MKKGEQSMATSVNPNSLSLPCCSKGSVPPVVSVCWCRGHGGVSLYSTLINQVLFVTLCCQRVVFNLTLEPDVEAMSCRVSLFHRYVQSNSYPALKERNSQNHRVRSYYTYYFYATHNLL